MLKVVITGNIASGKSVFEAFLKEKGYNVLDTDEVAHILLEKENVKNEILKSFESFNIRENGCLSRPKLGKIVFGNEILKKQLEGILHPLIKEEIQKYFQKNRNEKIVFVSVPLLFEAHFEDLFDKSIMVYADDKIRLERLIIRNNFSVEEAKIRMKNQIDQDEKTSMVDYVIYNNESINDLRHKSEELLILLNAEINNPGL